MSSHILTNRLAHPSVSMPHQEHTDTHTHIHARVCSGCPLSSLLPQEALLTAPAGGSSRHGSVLAQDPKALRRTHASCPNKVFLAQV